MLFLCLINPKKHVPQVQRPEAGVKAPALRKWINQTLKNY